MLAEEEEQYLGTPREMQAPAIAKWRRAGRDISFRPHRRIGPVSHLTARLPY